MEPIRGLPLNPIRPGVCRRHAFRRLHVPARGRLGTPVKFRACPQQPVGLLPVKYRITPDPESMSRFRPIDRQTDYLLPPSVQGMAARNASGALFGRRGRGAGSVGAGARVCGAWQRCLPPGDAAVAADLRLRDGDAFKPPDRTGDLRFAGVSVHRLQPAPGPRHPGEFPASVRRTVRRHLRASAAGGTREPARLWHGQPGRYRCTPTPLGTVRSLTGTREDRSAVQKPKCRRRKLAEAADQGNVPGRGFACGDQAARRPAGSHRGGKARSKPARRNVSSASKAEYEAKMAKAPGRASTGKRPGGPQSAWAGPGPRIRSI